MVNHLYYEGKWTPQDDRGTPQDVAERGAASGRGTDSVWIVRHRRDGRLMTGLMAQDLGPNGAPCWLMMIGSSTTQYIYIYTYIYIYYIEDGIIIIMAIQDLGDHFSTQPFCVGFENSQGFGMFLVLGGTRLV